jgi:hypothetical protein
MRIDQIGPARVCGPRGSRRRWRTVAVAALLAVACGVPGGLESPDERAVQALLLEVAGRENGAAATHGRTIVLETESGEPRFREPTAEELSSMWMPAPLGDVTVVAMECRYHPVWRVLFRAGPADDRGPALMAEVVSREDVPDVGREGAGALLLVARPWPMQERPDGTAIPDFRPILRGGGEGEEVPTRLVSIYPPWVAAK